VNARQNRHPADLLADTRAEIKALQKREDDLRRQLIESGDLIGAEWKAQIVNRTQERLDCGAVIKHFGKTALQPFFKMLEFDQVYLKRRKLPAETQQRMRVAGATIGTAVELDAAPERLEQSGLLSTRRAS